MKEEKSLLLGGDLALFNAHDQAGVLGRPFHLVFADERTEAQRGWELYLQNTQQRRASRIQNWFS